MEPSHKLTDKKEHILQVAEALFSENGFEGTSIRDIATAADVNVAMISYYFGSKEKLFGEMVQNRTAYMREMIGQLQKTETDPWKKVDAIIDLYSEKILHNTSFHKILYREMSMDQRSELNAIICEILSHNHIEFAKIIEDGIAKKVFRKVDVPLTIGSIMGTINQSTMSKNLVCKVLREDPTTYDLKSPEHISRMKKHLKQMMHAHLSIPNKQ
jgi:AcrR family transcriptional regulator